MEKHGDINPEYTPVVEATDKLAAVTDPNQKYIDEPMLRVVSGAVQARQDSRIAAQPIGQRPSLLGQIPVNSMTLQDLLKFGRGG